MKRRTKMPKALKTAMFKHRIDPTKNTAASIIKKFELKQHANFYREFYHAAMAEV